MNRVWMGMAALLLVSCAPPTRPEGKPLSSHVDAVLGPSRNEVDGRVVLGSVGRRLWAEVVDRKPGLRGEFYYLHGPALCKTLFQLGIWEADRRVLFPSLIHQWWPSHVGMEGRADGLHLMERKYITEDDCAIDLVHLKNESTEARTLRLRVQTDLPTGADLRGKNRLFDVDFAYALRAEGFQPTSVSRSVHAAFNPDRTSDVQPRASFTWSSDSMWFPIDGDAESEQRWSCWSSGNEQDWYEIEFREERQIHRVVLTLADDQAGIVAPLDFRIQYEKGRILADVPEIGRVPERPSAGRNEVRFQPVRTRRLRVLLSHPKGYYSGIRELEVYPGEKRQIPVLERAVILLPGESISFPIEMAFGETSRPGDAQDLLEAHLRAYNSWFEENIPDFDCSDPWFVKLWYYRWYVVRRALAEPKCGLLRHPVFYPSRSTLEGSRAIPQPLPAEEIRWLRDSRYALGYALSFFENQFQGSEGFFDGQFPILQVDRRINSYRASWMGAVPWAVHLVHPDPRFLEAQIPRMKRYVQGLLDRFDSDRDGLPAVTAHAPTADDAHRHTGLDFQPSFFWFNDSPSDTSRGTSLERVDSTCYLYACVHALEVAGVDMGDLAEKIRAAMCRKMWDLERKFFYSLEPETDRRALVEEVVGFYPHAFGLVPVGDRQYDAVFDRLFDPDQFWAPFPVHTTSKRAEFFSLDVPGGRHANGPTWLTADVVVLEALANAIRLYRVPSVTRRRFFDFLQRMVHLQFESGNFLQPRIATVYHSETGRPKTRSVDAFRSTYADFMIRTVGGLTPRPDATLEFYPIVDALSHFRFQRIPYRGDLLDIMWDPPGGRDVYGDGLEGFTVKRNGKVLFTAKGLLHVTWTENGGLHTEE